MIVKPTTSTVVILLGSYKGQEVHNWTGLLGLVQQRGAWRCGPPGGYGRGAISSHIQRSGAGGGHVQLAPAILNHVQPRPPSTDY